MVDIQRPPINTILCWVQILTLTFGVGDFFTSPFDLVEEV